ncbi:Yps1p [Sugiyamaella lignohabitans]|uniref:Yps1p n=1 Tax=Sugiyamaella lignohabitans TaxID=796027 RepID=A0A167FDC7_9ASCO|nr:Yps1p [Sugiyamaella lignohabitans]ANB15154.1 Yps1p [Sugiyamaella lignohabitans]
MKLTSASILLASVSLAVAAPANGKGYLLAKTQLRTITPPDDVLDKRSGSYDTPLANEIYEYIATFELGTPGQTIEAQIDTGSSDLWVYTPAVHETTPFNSKKSSTYKYLNGNFEIDYVKGSASGNWVTDTLTIDGVSLKNQQFATVAQDEGSTGVFGIGLEADEASSTEYVNVPQNLVNQGYISHNAYSLYLDDLEASEGALLFGAVDSAKYSGKLYTLPLISNSAFQVTLSGISGSTGTSLGGATYGILDSGTSYTFLPSADVSAIASYLGATYDSRQKAYFFDSPPSKSIVYNFSGATITIPPSELAVPASSIHLTNTKPYFLPILPNTQSSGYNLLGDSFLRSAYVVYDLENKEVSIAQASWNNANSNIQIISGTVPGAVPAPNA